jgi:hypothetical protein
VCYTWIKTDSCRLRPRLEGARQRYRTENEVIRDVQNLRLCKVVQGDERQSAGRPPGSRNRSSLLFEQLLEGDGEAIIKKLLERAKEGDTSAMKLCIECLLPVRKERLVELPAGPMEHPADARLSFQGVLRRWRSAASHPRRARRSPTS